MKTKTFLFAILVAFMFASCEEEEQLFNYKFRVTTVRSRIPVQKPYPITEYRTFTEYQLTEKESDEIVKANTTYEEKDMYGMLLTFKTTCYKVRL